MTGNFLNASGLGSGKQFMALAAAKVLNKKVIALARLGALSSWQEIGVGHFGFSSTDVYAINREQIKTGKHWLGTWRTGEHNPETGRTAKSFHWNVPSDTILIFDEIHSEAGLDSLNSQMLKDAVRQGVKVLGLSGTTADDPRKMRAIGYMLGLHQDWDFWQWLSLYGATKDSWNFNLPSPYLGTKRGKADLSARRLAAMEKINAQLVKAGRMVRLPTSQIPGFPKVTIQPVCVSFGNARLAEIYEEMKAEFLKLNQKGIGGKGLGILMPMLQKAEMLMVPEIVEEVQDAKEEGSSVVIFVNFKGTVEALASRLKTDCVFHGDQSQAEKDYHRKRFERDEMREIIVTSAAGGESVSFADRRGQYSRVGLVIPGFQAQVINQVLGRLPRDGAMSPSIYRLLFPRGTWLEKAYRACQRRTELYGAFNGDTRFTDDDLLEGLAA